MSDKIKGLDEVIEDCRETHNQRQALIAAIDSLRMQQHNRDEDGKVGNRKKAEAMLADFDGNRDWKEVKHIHDGTVVESFYVADKSEWYVNRKIVQGLDLGRRVVVVSAMTQVADTEIERAFGVMINQYQLKRLRGLDALWAGDWSRFVPDCWDVYSIPAHEECSEVQIELARVLEYLASRQQS